MLLSIKRGLKIIKIIKLLKHFVLNKNFKKREIFLLPTNWIYCFGRDIKCLFKDHLKNDFF